MDSKASAMAEFDKNARLIEERIEDLRRVIRNRINTVCMLQYADWGDVGSLQKVAHELGDILEFLGAPKPD